MASIGEIEAAIRGREAELLGELEGTKIIEREFCIPSGISRNFATIITGPRRSGKSVFAFMRCKGLNYGYVNFEDERLRINSSELDNVLEALYSIKGSNIDVYLFDEIQNVPGWESFISRLLGTKKIMITGSNSRLLSKELGTAMTGRHVDIEMFPFSFREFLDYKGINRDPGNSSLTASKPIISRELKEYIHDGGYPSTIESNIKGVILTNLYQDVLERDIIQRYGIRLSSKIKEAMRYIVSNTSGQISYGKLRNIVGIKSTSTITEWISYAEAAYLIFKLERYSTKLKDSILAPKKIYCIDTGMAVSVSSDLSTQLGRLIENVVAVELLRRKAYGIDINQSINYWKDYSHREVDFVIRHGRKIECLIQVTYAESLDKIPDREFESLIRASEELECNNLTIITWNYKDRITKGGKTINMIPLWLWLLDYKVPQKR